MEEGSIEKKSETTLEDLKKPFLIEGIPLPETFEEVLSTEHPYITVRFNQQIILTEHWPTSFCNHCHGVGIVGLARDKNTPSVSKSQPNKPCICGSGKKYKRCCRKSIETYVRNQSQVVLCKCVGNAKPLKIKDNKEGRELIKKVIEEANG